MPGVNRDSHFTRWIQQNGGCKASNPSEATHLLLSGATLKVPDETKTLELLANDILDGHANYVVERRTTIFRFCQDYDFITPFDEGVTVEQLAKYLSKVQVLLQEIFPQLLVDKFTAVLCSAPLKKQTKDVVIDVLESSRTGSAKVFKSSRTESRSLTKSGYHVIWPDIFVDRPSAIRIRFIIRQALKTAYPNVGEHTIASHDSDEVERIRFDSWDNILDLTIYIENGLRMLGSHKASRCKTCKKSASEARNSEARNSEARSSEARNSEARNSKCTDCLFGGKKTGFIDDGRPYRVEAVVDGRGDINWAQTTALKSDHLKALQATSIRCIGGETAIEPLTPKWFLDEVDIEKVLEKLSGTDGALARKRRRPTTARRLDGGGESASSLRGDWGAAGEIHSINLGNRYYDFEVVSPIDDQRAIIFEAYLNDSILHGSERIFLRKIMICSDVKKPYIFAVGSTKFCINVGREHNGQDVFYLFNGKQVEQRCWSSKEGPDRKHGPCTQTAAIDFFRKSGVKLPMQKFRELFPLSVPKNASSIMIQQPPQKPPQHQQQPQQQPITHDVITAPGNRSAGCSPKMCQQQLIAEQYMREIAAYPGLAGKTRSFGRMEELDEIAEAVTAEDVGEYLEA